MEEGPIIDINLHPYYIDAYFRETFAGKFDLQLKYKLLSLYCFPDLTEEQLKELLPDISWETVVKLSLFYTPILESAGEFNPLSLYFQSLSHGFSNPEYFIQDMLKDRLSFRESIILMVIAFIYGRENIYSDIIRVSPNPELVNSILTKRPLRDYSPQIVEDTLNILFDMVGISCLDIVIIVSLLPNTNAVTDLISGTKGQVNNLYSLYGAILSYADERIADYLQIERHAQILESSIRDHARRLAGYLSSNLVYLIPDNILGGIYDYLPRKAKNILGCYKVDKYTVIDTSSYFTSESYLQYLLSPRSQIVNDDSVYNTIGTIGYSL